MTLVVKKKKKKFPCQCRAREMGSLPGSGRSLGEENGNPLQYSCLENPTDWGAWQATVCGVTKSWTQLSAWTHTQGTLSQLGLQLSVRTELRCLSIYACKLANGHLASSLSWYLVKCSKEQQTCTDSLSCFSISSARIMGSIAKVSKC